MGIVDRAIDRARGLLGEQAMALATRALGPRGAAPAGSGVGPGARPPANIWREITSPSPYAEKRPYTFGQNLTPSAVSSALRLAELGYMQRLSDLESELREKLPHLQAVLATRELAITACLRRGKWAVLPADVKGAGKTRKAAEVADYVRRRFQRLPAFADSVGHLMGGVYFGRSACETLWARDAEGIYPGRLVTVHPRRLSYATKHDWAIHLYDETGNEHDPSLGTLPGLDLRNDPRSRDKFVIHEPKTVGAEYPTRQGVGRSLVFTGCFLRWTYAEWMQFAELFARPWRIGSFDKVIDDDDDIATLETALKQLGSATTAVLPSGAKVEILSPKGEQKTHEQLRTAFNAEISKVVLGQTSTTELGDSGSYAATKVHDTVRQDILTADGASISETITRDLVMPMVRRTFGALVAETMCPRFELVTQPEEDRDAEFTRFEGLAGLGVSFDADEARERFTTLSKPAEDAVLLKPPPKPAPAMPPGAPSADAAANADQADEAA
jgi:phage gp29-like protein